MGKLARVRVKFWVSVRVELGLGLGLIKVVGFTAFKPLKLLVSREESASCPFHCGETSCVVISFNRKTLNLSDSVERNKQI